MFAHRHSPTVASIVSCFKFKWKLLQVLFKTLKIHTAQPELMLLPFREPAEEAWCMYFIPRFPFISSSLECLFAVILWIQLGFHKLKENHRVSSLSLKWGLQIVMVNKSILQKWIQQPVLSAYEEWKRHMAPLFALCVIPNALSSHSWKTACLYSCSQHNSNVRGCRLIHGKMLASTNAHSRISTV